MLLQSAEMTCPPQAILPQQCLPCKILVSGSESFPGQVSRGTSSKCQSRYLSDSGLLHGDVNVDIWPTAAQITAFRWVVCFLQASARPVQTVHAILHFLKNLLPCVLSLGEGTAHFHTPLLCVSCCACRMPQTVDQLFVHSQLFSVKGPGKRVCAAAAVIFVIPK